MTAAERYRLAYVERYGELSPDAYTRLSLDDRLAWTDERGDCRDTATERRAA